ncbi:MAG: glycosyltransferase family 4 protein [Deltaproteobacteria bacterium]
MSKRKNNILLITPVFEQGGTETYIINLIEYLNKNNYSPIVMSDGGVREKELISIGVEHIKVDCLRKKSIFNLLKALHKIVPVLKNEEIQLIHASSVYTTIISKIASVLCFRRKIKVFMTLHGGPTKDIEKKSARILNIFADKVIALSEQGNTLLIKHGLKKDKIVIINNGVKSLENMKRNKTDKIVIGSSGRLSKEKGYEYLIEAASKINLPDIEFWIAGDGSLKAEFEKMLKDAGMTDKFKLLGFTDQISKVLNNIDIFILPSLWEGFGISIIEAMSLGKPVIATNVGGIPEVLGDCGLLINPANVDEIANSIKLLVENEEMRKELGQKAKERFNNNFTQEIMGEKTIRVYEEMLKA